jgi:hypothetical protein
VQSTTTTTSTAAAADNDKHWLKLKKWVQPAAQAHFNDTYTFPIPVKGRGSHFFFASLAASKIPS